MKVLLIAIIVTALSLLSCHSTKSALVSAPTDAEAEYTIKLVEDVVWEKLNPARGDKSPQAGTLWGNRKSEVATGFLAKFVDGFSSPPHIHNVTYRAVVLSGKIHNDDENAEPMWMGQGSFWTQPAGQPHITAAQGETNIAYVEIDSGPYLVKPTDEAKDNGERPINIDQSNVIWMSNVDSEWLKTTNEAKIAHLWGTLDGWSENGSFLKLPANFQGQIVGLGNGLTGIVVQGNVSYSNPKQTDVVDLNSGSMFSSKYPAKHFVTNNGQKDCLIYIRAKGNYQVI